MMKRSIYIFSAFFSLLNLNVLGQEDFYRLETKDVKYIIDTTEFNVISVDVTNSCKHNLILWLDKQDVTDLSLEHKIRHYFFTKKGDLSACRNKKKRAPKSIVLKPHCATILQHHVSKLPWL